jgi:hypothetical protein
MSGVAAGFALTGLAADRAGPVVAVLAGAALAVLMRRDTFDEAGAAR